MKLITRDSDYALRALCFIAKNKKRTVSVSELVRALRIPRPFLRKILQILNKKGILFSCKGQGGGFSLVKPKEKIFLLDVIKVFQGPFKLNECLLKNSPCPNIARCPLKRKIDSIEKYVIKQLKPITIAYLLRH